MLSYFYIFEVLKNLKLIFSFLKEKQKRKEKYKTMHPPNICTAVIKYKIFLMYVYSKTNICYGILVESIFKYLVPKL